MEAQRSHEPESSSARAEQAQEAESIELLPAQINENLDAQCKRCLENLERCIKVTERAAQVPYSLGKSLIPPLRDALQNDESLLSDILVSHFARLQADAEAIFRDICNLETAAQGASKATDSNIESAFISQMARAQENIEKRCHDLAQCLYALAKLQDPIHMSLATQGKGPEADLHSWIKKYRENFAGDDNVSSKSGDRASHGSGDRLCSNCQQWFPAHALSFHRESCEESEQRKYQLRGSLRGRDPRCSRSVIVKSTGRKLNFESHCGDVIRENSRYPRQYNSSLVNQKSSGRGEEDCRQPHRIVLFEKPEGYGGDESRDISRYSTGPQTHTTTCRPTAHD
ncbi:hypothetical protein GQ53DRAFT_766195 [Thozetella sp. PMI_491]|nr:hypothetical protein GQ53DRAFT_766195 [Thozetella sp. PMI_491]